MQFLVTIRRIDKYGFEFRVWFNTDYILERFATQTLYLDNKFFDIIIIKIQRIYSTFRASKVLFSISVIFILIRLIIFYLQFQLLNY